MKPSKILYHPYHNDMYELEPYDIGNIAYCQQYMKKGFINPNDEEAFKKLKNQIKMTGCRNQRKYVKNNDNTRTSTTES